MNHAMLKELVRMRGDEPLPDWAAMPTTLGDLERLVQRINREPMPRGDGRYADYLASPEWRTRRLIVLVLARQKCACCPLEATQVHHLTYARRGRELLNDLLPLCDGCHDQKHSPLNKYQEAK
jgi:5-methylcytosine-specific restriction endonuclease McrA